jgi:hypothetical protein
VRLELDNGNSRAVERAVVERRIDLVLVVNSTRHGDCVVADLFEDRVGFVDDVIAANGDWTVANEGVLLLQARWPDGFGLRFGAYSALRAVPAAGYVGHQMGPIAMLSFGRLDPAVYGLGIFVRLGVYTHHRFRAGEAGTMLGLSVDWDAGGL